MVTHYTYSNQTLKQLLLKRNFTLLFTAFIFSSCATLSHRPTVVINIQADVEAAGICINNDTTRWYLTPANIMVNRSKKPLLITAKKDSIQKTFQIKSRLSGAFLVGNIFMGFPYSYAIDLLNSKRFNYPPDLIIHFKSPVPYISKALPQWVTPEKGLLGFSISIPEINSFYINEEYNYGNTSGFLGISGELGYYFTNKYSFKVKAGAAIDFGFPIPVPLDYFSGFYERSSATFAAMQLGSDYRRFHLDAGLQFTHTNYYKSDIFSSFPYFTDTITVSQKQNNAGFAFSTQYKISRGFSLGLNYYPSLAAWNKSFFQIHYSHLIFLDLIFNMGVHRRGNIDR